MMCFESKISSSVCFETNNWLIMQSRKRVEKVPTINYYNSVMLNYHIHSVRCQHLILIDLTKGTANTTYNMALEGIKAP